MKYVLLLLTLILVVLHQDLWLWGRADPLAFGFLPVGLWYHAVFCLATSLVLALFVTSAWPKHLEDAEPQTPEARRAEGYADH